MDMSDQYIEIYEYVDGMKDCREGAEHKNRNPSYNRGYAAEHEMQEVRTHQTEQQQ